MARLLVVDDSEQNLYMLRVLLEGHGHEVTCAEDGAQALEAARREPPEMVVSDILMPVMDGFTLCRQWQADGQLQGIPFVFYTATYTDPKDEAFALSLGAERFIVKPKEPDRFMEILGEVITEHESGRLTAPHEPVEQDPVYLKEYNEALIRKLEDKMLQLEVANQVLEQEVAERERTEEALRESEEKYRLAMEATTDALWDWNVETGETYYSPAWGVILGDPPLEPRFQSWETRIHREDKPHVQDSLRAHLAGQTPLWTCEHRLRDRHGQWKWMLGRGRVVHRDPQGEPLRMVGTTVDVTDRKCMEAELRQRETELAHAGRVHDLGAMALTMAHELKQPLHAIRMFAEAAVNYLQTDEAGIEKATDVLGRLVSECQRAAKSLDHFRKLVRKKEPHRTAVDVNVLLQELLDLVGPYLRDNDVSLALDLADELPMVVADPIQLEQVLLNLVRNGVEAMGDTRPDQRALTLATSLGPGGALQVAVRDTGPGLSQHLARRVFEPFFSTKEDGLGLGLAISRSIVESYGGSVTAESDSNEGATFRLALPGIGDARE